ncbi:MAG TPA: hypothetical protein VFW87_06080 [Pirellulales bacterium]|nr:hypothetical protein [Pirellulales bacterium]
MTEKLMTEKWAGGASRQEPNPASHFSVSHLSVIPLRPTGKRSPATWGRSAARCQWNDRKIDDRKIGPAAPPDKSRTQLLIFLSAIFLSAIFLSFCFIQRANGLPPPAGDRPRAADGMTEKLMAEK